MRTCLLLTLYLLLRIVPALGQDRTLAGRVTDKAGEPLPGVNVLVKGTTVGAVTNGEGIYSLQAPADGRLVFSSIGYVAQEIAVPAAGNADVTLQEDVTSLEEVVVTGLATSVKRSNLANAVGVISAKELVGTTRPATLDGAMNGKVAGASISANSGAPGGGFSVKLRGISSINGSSEPLYIVDGVYVDNSQFQTGAGTSAFAGATSLNTGSAAGRQDQAANRIADLNPADIESIEILKGPSAAAIYGTRANAGVILITTKKGRSGETSIQFGQDVGFARALRLIGMHRTPWSREKIDEGVWLATPENMAALFEESGSGSRTYDYEQEVYGNTGLLRNTRLNLSGGTDKLRFYAAGSTTDEEGIQRKTGFRRHSVRLNLDFKVNPSIDVTVNSNYVNSGSDRSFSGNDNNGVSLGYNLALLPNWLDQYPDENGIYPANPLTGQNPLQIVDRAENREQTNRFIQSFLVNVYLLRKTNHSLKFSAQGGADYLLTQADVFMPDDLQFQQQRANPGAARFTKTNNLNTNIQGFFVDQLVLHKLALTTSLGAVRLATTRDVSVIQGEGLKGGQRNPNTAVVRTTYNHFSRWQDVGLVVQEELNWDDKVILTGGVRFDKSSLNGDHTRWYAFPKASAAVNVHNLVGWNTRFLSALKVRAAYGQTGGVPSFGDYFTSFLDVVYDGQNGAVAPALNGYPKVAPETASEVETGLDVGLLDNRLNLEITYYDKRIYNFLNPFALSPGTGVAQLVAFPVGDLRNRGLEVGLNLNPVSTRRLVWNTTLNYWFNRSKVTRLDVPEFGVSNSGFGSFGTNRVRLGESPTRWYGTPLNAAGLPTRYEDAQPRLQLSWYNTISFLKSFEFSFLLHTSQGGYNASLNQELTDEGGTSPDWSDRTPDGRPVGMARRLGQPGVTTRQFIQDASFVRLREIALYYNLPQAALPRFVKGVRVGASGNNVGLWTNYYGYDPEASNFGNRPVGTGVDLLSFPSSRRLFFHLNVDL